MSSSSSRTSLFLAVLLSLLIGAAIGYFAGQLGTEIPPPTNAQNDSRPQINEKDCTNREDVGIASPRPDPNPPIENTKPTAPESVSNSIDNANDSVGIDSLRDRIEKSLADLPPVEQEKGDGEITGTVVDAESGAPLQGVLIQANGRREQESNSGNPRRPTSGDPEPNSVVAAEILRAAEKALERRSLYYTARTSEDGSYTISGLASAAYNVSPRSPDYEFRHVPGQANDEQSPSLVKPGTRVNFVATRRYAVTMEIQMPDGSPAIGVGVGESRAPDGVGLEDAKSAAAGYRYYAAFSWNGPGDFRYLTAGIYAFRVSPKPEHGSVTADPVVIRVGDNSDNHVVIRLRAVPGLKVSVKDETGVVNRDFRYYVQAMAWSDVGEPTEALLQNFRNTAKDDQAYGSKLLLAPDQVAQFVGLTPGRHAVAALTYNPTKIHAWAFVNVTGDESEVTVVIPLPPMESYITAWVKDPDGNLIDLSVEYVLRAMSGDREQTADGRPARLVDGSVRIMWFEPKLLPKDVPLTWTLSFSHGKYGRVSQVVVPSLTREVHLQFLDTGVLRLEVAGMAGHPVREKLRALMYEVIDGQTSSTYDPRQFGTATTSGFVFLPRQPCTVEVLLYIQSDYGTLLELSSGRATIVAGDCTCRLTLPPLHSISINAPRSEPGLQVSLFPMLAKSIVSSSKSGGFSQRAFLETGSDRKASFEFIPAGTYSLKAWDKNGIKYSDKQVNVPDISSFTLLPD